MNILWFKEKNKQTQHNCYFPQGGYEPLHGVGRLPAQTVWQARVSLAARPCGPLGTPLLGSVNIDSEGGDAGQASTPEGRQAPSWAAERGWSLDHRDRQAGKRGVCGQGQRCGQRC
jgi:hypothetical protein